MSEIKKLKDKQAAEDKSADEVFKNFASLGETKEGGGDSAS